MREGPEEHRYRSQIHSSSLGDIMGAHLEHGGDISIIKAKRPRILEVSAAEGVQTARVQID